MTYEYWAAIEHASVDLLTLALISNCIGLPSACDTASNALVNLHSVYYTVV